MSHAGGVAVYQERLEARLEAWEDELRTNQHRMAYLAERAIAVLRIQIADYERAHRQMEQRGEQP